MFIHKVKWHCFQHLHFETLLFQNNIKEAVGEAYCIIVNMTKSLQIENLTKQFNLTS